MEDLVFHYTDLMDELGLSQPYVVGLSLGGWLAAEFATRYSNRMRKLALINAVGLQIPGAPFADIFAASPTQTRSLIFSDPDSRLAKSFIPDDAPPEMVSDALKARAATARVGWNPYLCNRKLRERLYRISVPTLIVWGESDRLVPHVHAKAYQDGIAGAQFVAIKDCGHAPPLEKPQETVQALVDFFNA
jgi:pimeloyl-ACP methyl ester carboxylesterase